MTERTDPITLRSPEVCEDSDLMIIFEKETHKHAIWGGVRTKQYLKWKANQIIKI